MTTLRTTFLFPGQGSQYRGIGSDLHLSHEVVRDTYTEASDVLGLDIANLSFEDSDGEINLTRNTQPVLLTHSVSCWRLLNASLPGTITPNIAAGHSVGEYAALVCAASLSFEEALKLVRSRGELMGEYGEGQMEALMIDYDSAASLAEQHYCGIAACNLPDQNVVGGREEDLDRLVATMAERFPRKRSARLKTEGAFHTYYMVEAALHYREVLEAADFQLPQFSVMSNFTGGAHDADVDSIRSRLFLQLFNPVLWYRNLRSVEEQGVDVLVEFGGGLGKGETPSEKRPNLESMVKKTFRGSETPPQYLSVINQQSLEETLDFFRTG